MSVTNHVMTVSGLVESSDELRPSGIPTIGAVAWGSHVCQFYRTQSDLAETLVAFFKAGLESNERCLWITSDEIPVADARARLSAAVRDLDARIESGQIDIVDQSEWYARPAKFGNESALGECLRREAEARARGYEGLRVSGNVFWDESAESVAVCDAGILGAMPPSRIIALCNYALDGCSPDRVIDVLRNHGRALLRRNGSLEVVESATVLLAALEAETRAAAVEPQAIRRLPTPIARSKHHAVRFFQASEYPADDIAEYLLPSLSGSGAALVFATEEHLALLRAALRVLGHDVSRSIETGKLVLRDAEESAAALLESAPEQVFEERVVKVVQRLLTNHDRVSVYGEIVDVLCRRRAPELAVKLECLWNELLTKGPIELLCGYAIESLADARTMPEFRRICDEHSDVEPMLGSRHRESARIAAELQQTTAALLNEVANRAELERERDQLREAEQQARAQAMIASEHVARLQRATSALCEAATTSDVAQAVVMDLTSAFGAHQAAIYILEHDGMPLVLLGQAGLSSEQLEPLSTIPHDGSLPMSAVCRSAVQLWASSPEAIAERNPELSKLLPRIQSFGCAPISSAGSPLGAIALFYETPHEPGAGERALFDDYAKQVALALDRARSYDDAQRARRRLEVLAETSARISAAKLDLTEIVDAIVRELTRTGFADCAAIHLLSDDRTELCMTSMHHAAAGALGHNELVFGDQPLDGTSVIGRVAQTGTSVRIAAVDEPTEGSKDALEGVRSSLAVVPLRASGEVIGTLSATRRIPKLPFGFEDESLLLEIADRGALSIDNARLYERAHLEKERAEQERCNAEHERQRVESANRAKDEFLAVLGHELRNPLSPILTAVQLMQLRGGRTLEKERTIIERQVNHMVRLVDDLLDVSRITRGKVQLKREPVEIAQVVADAIEIASPMLEERTHKLVTLVPASGLRVLADPNRLAQVVANLLTNAAKYTPAGGLIEVSARASCERIELAVRDTGVGIDSELLPHVFDLFVQGRQSIDRSKGGLGLGLTIARTLTEMHGGRVRASSAGPGLGSEFVVELPLFEGAGFTDSVVPRPATPLRALGRKVLVVDDNIDAANVLADALVAVGHEVHTAHDGPSALDAAARFKPEVALLDIGLPVMDGYELARHLASAQPDLKLIAITGYGQETDRERSHAAGFSEHLVKPIDFMRLITLISKDSEG